MIVVSNLLVLVFSSTIVENFAKIFPKKQPKYEIFRFYTFDLKAFDKFYLEKIFLHPLSRLVERRDEIFFS